MDGQEALSAITDPFDNTRCADPSWQSPPDRVESAMTITHQAVIDDQGKPAAALIPWAEFVRIQQLLADPEVTAEEAAVLREAEADRRTGNHSAFTDLASLKAELSL